MSLSEAGKVKLHRILFTWTRALTKSIDEHGIPNSFGVIELAGEFNLNPRDGYRLGQTRISYLHDWLLMDCSSVAYAAQFANDGPKIRYRKGRFYV